MSEAQKLNELDAKQIEQEMIQAAENRAVDPAESAAMVFHMYKPELQKRIPRLSSKALRRVFQLLIEFPLNDKKLKATSQLEQEVFMLADSMLQAKFVLVMDTYKNSAEELIKAQDEIFKGAVTEEVSFEEPKEEPSNG